ncbi:MAG: hypothetical protein JWN70_4084 [Planctomycetaceae bacterium]|nr:hypothetical protein [Planctomycetaceae bacterium]
MPNLDSPDADIDPGSATRVRITKSLLWWGVGLTIFATVLVAVLTVWIQRTVVLNIRSLRGEVHYSGECDARGLSMAYYGEPYGPALIRKFIGDDVFDFPVAVKIFDSFATPHSKVQYRPLIAQLPRLRMVTLVGCPLEVNDLDQLSRLRELKMLILSNSIGNDSDLSMLKGLQLEWLTLNHNPISDRGLQSLEQMTSLQVLDLESTKVSDLGLRFLEKLPNLKTVVILDTAVTREGYEQFTRKCPHCVVRWSEHRIRPAP